MLFALLSQTVSFQAPRLPYPVTLGLRLGMGKFRSVFEVYRICLLISYNEIVFAIFGKAVHGV